MCRSGHGFPSSTPAPITHVRHCATTHPEAAALRSLSQVSGLNILVSTLAFTCLPTPTSVHTYQTGLHKCVHLQLHTCAHIHMHACTHVRTHTHIHACTRVYIFTHTHTQTSLKLIHSVGLSTSSMSVCLSPSPTLCHMDCHTVNPTAGKCT